MGHCLGVGKTAKPLLPAMSFATFSIRPKSTCDNCQRRGRCSGGRPCQRCQRLNLNCHYSNKRPCGPKRAEIIDMNVSRLGISDVLEASGGLACANVSPTAESWIQTPICTSLPADDYPLYDPAMGGLGARANASETGPILDTNSGYVPASIMPPELRLEDLSFHSTLNPMSSLPGEQWQCTMMPDPVVPIRASTYQSETMGDLARSNACERTRDGTIAAGTSRKLRKHGSACDECNLARTKCSQGQPCERCDSLKTSCYYSVPKRPKTNSVFPCLFEQCDRATADDAFPSRWNCFDHMRRIHGYAAPYDDYKLQARAVGEAPNGKQKEQILSPLEPTMKNTELHEANDHKRFPCLFHQCDQAFLSKQDCYKHMKDEHHFSDGFDVYAKLIDRQELMDRQAQ